MLNAQAAEPTAASPNTRKTPALRAKVYEQLARAQALAEYRVKLTRSIGGAG